MTLIQIAGASCIFFALVTALPWIIGSNDFFRLPQRLRRIYLGAIIGIPGLIISSIALIILLMRQS